MRFFLIALAITACAPPAPTSSAPAERPPSAANADARAVQQAAMAGQWTTHADEGTFAARFTGADGAELFSVVCTAPNGAITLTLHQAEADVSTMKIITATHTLDLPVRARGSSITARFAESAAEHDALITVLGTPDERFSLQVGDATTVFPWDDGLRTTLSACEHEEPLSDDVLSPPRL